MAKKAKAAAKAALSSKQKVLNLGELFDELEKEWRDDPSVDSMSAYIRKLLRTHPDRRKKR